MTGDGAQHPSYVRAYGGGGSSSGGMSAYGNEEPAYVVDRSSLSSLAYDHYQQQQQHAGPSNSTSGGGGGGGGSGTSTASPSGMITTRVAKACVPCSTKKRRCDGGKPQCKVCMVLGSACSYETRGLKRGPPKGFRSGPKESAKAKLLRTLETTIRDLALHMGREDTEREIVRISGERGIQVHAPRPPPTSSSSSSKLDKRERSAPAAAPTSVSESGAAGAEVAEDVLGISEQGTFRYIGSSSGIQLLHNNSHHHHHHHHHHHPTAPPPPAPPPSQYGKGSPSSRSLSHPLHPSPIPLPSVSSVRLHGSSPSTTSGPSASSTTPHVLDNGKLISRSMNRRLFQHYWTGFHTFWPVLYKPAFDHMDVDRLPEALDVALVYAIYAIAACVAHPTLDHELEHELGDGPAGEVFAQRAEQHLFQTRSTPLPSFASIQSCFILSCYHQGAGQLSKAYLFSSLANGMAIDLGLHRHLHQYEHDRIERESRSRLIHCIHILSTLLSAEMGRPPMLRSKDIDVPPLSEKENDEHDFDGSTGTQLHTLSLLNHSRRLFAIVETVLSQVHSFRRKAALRRMGSEGIRQVVDEIDESLESWRRSLPEWLRLDDNDDDEKQTAPVPSFAAVQVWYYTAKILLHRPFIPQDEGLALSDLLNDKYHRKCTEAAQSSFDLLQRLAKASSVDQLSTDLAYIIFTTAVMFVFNARLVPQTDDHGNADLHSVRSLSTNAKRQFLMCKEWLRKLSDRWPSASAHKQLLDGFAVVGEGVLDGEPHQYVGRRPSLLTGDPADVRPTSSSAGGISMAAARFSNGLPSYDMASVAPSSSSSSSYHFTSDGPPAAAAYDIVYGPGALTADVLNSNNAAVVDSQQSLNAYFEFAPNIFDMENVYWNETATRSTPYIGPRDGTASFITVPMSNTEDQQPGYSNVNTSFTPRTFANFATIASSPMTMNHAAAAAAAASSMAPPPLSSSSSAAITARSSRVQSPRKRSRASDKNDDVTNSSDSPGLQMLAHQAVQTTGGGGLSVDEHGVAMINTPPHHFVSTPSSTTASTANRSGSTLAVTQGSGVGVGVGNGTIITSSYSPFSFHQEPSAPEWGDVISMLQLPPAFIQ